MTAWFVHGHYHQHDDRGHDHSNRHQLGVMYGHNGDQFAPHIHSHTLARALQDSIDKLKEEAK